MKIIEKIRLKVKRTAYVAVTRALARAAKNDYLRGKIQYLLRIIINSIRGDIKNYYQNRATSDLAQLMHETLAGRWIINQHGFGRIIGETKAISFIFPFYKKEKEILNAIKTLKNQIFNKLSLADIEIIVIDDGSKDLLDEHIDQDVIYLRRNKFGYGISRSRNLGAKIANGRVLCFVDPDFEFPNDYVENLYSEYLKYGPRTVITGYISDYFYNGCPDPRVAFGAWENPNRKTKRFLQLAGGHMAISRDLFSRVGGFDEDLIYGEVEDTFYGFLLSKEPDVDIVFSTKVNVRHVPHPLGLAHQSPEESFRVAAFKAPDFYKTYVLDGKR